MDPTNQRDPSAFDVHRVDIDPATREVIAAAILRDRLTWTAIDPAFAADLAAMCALHHGDLGIVSASADGATLIANYLSDTGPIAYFTYDRRSCRGHFMFYIQPALCDHTLAPMQPIELTARDGLVLSGYLTLPVGLPPRQLPTVLYVHGGPWYRDRWGFDPVVQWLANRGYAVLQINFRGSTGYGKAFVNAGDREWAGAMRTDLLDAPLHAPPTRSGSTLRPRRSSPITSAVAPSQPTPTRRSSRSCADPSIPIDRVALTMARPDRNGAGAGGSAVGRRGDGRRAAASAGSRNGFARGGRPGQDGVWMHQHRRP